MKEHSRRILGRAAKLLERYRTGQVSFRSLVCGLEASLDSLEERLPDDFYARWHAHWDELETVLAIGEYQERQQEIVEERKQDILDEVGALENLLAEYVSWPPSEEGCTLDM